MLDELTRMMLQRKLVVPHQSWGLHDALTAVATAVSPMKQGKQIILFS